MPHAVGQNGGTIDGGDREKSHALQSTAIDPSHKRNALQVLEALEYVHARGITYRNLTPKHIMWFANEFTWKLVDVEYASSEGEPTIPHRIGTYDPPESIEAERHGKEGLPLHPAADMWSFGIIAFEVLTSACASPAKQFRYVRVFP